VTIYRQIIARNCFRQITADARAFVGDAQQSRARSMITLRALRHIRHRLHANPRRAGRQPGQQPAELWRSIEQDYVIAAAHNK